MMFLAPDAILLRLLVPPFHRVLDPDSINPVPNLDHRININPDSGPDLGIFKELKLIKFSFFSS